jgi:uncharacterized protein
MTKVKTCPVAIKAAGEQDGTDDGVFEAIVATYDLDSYGDKITPGAFAKTLDEWAASGNPIPVLWSHMSVDPMSHIGFVEEAEERADVGLWVKARLDLDNPKAAQVYRLLKGRRVTQFSFAYDVVEGKFVEQVEDGEDSSYFALDELKLHEVGPCLIGANRQTELLDVKSADGARVVFTIGPDTTPETVRAAIKAAREADAPADTGKGDQAAPRYRYTPPEGLAPAGTKTTEEGTPAKAGRVLSAKNEETIGGVRDGLKAAAKTLTGLLDSLSDDAKVDPAAPSPSPAPEAKDATAGQDDAPHPRRHVPGLVGLRIAADVADL